MRGLHPTQPRLVIALELPDGLRLGSYPTQRATCCGSSRQLFAGVLVVLRHDMLSQLSTQRDFVARESACSRLRVSSAPDWRLPDAAAACVVFPCYVLDSRLLLADGCKRLAGTGPPGAETGAGLAQRPNVLESGEWQSSKRPAWCGSPVRRRRRWRSAVVCCPKHCCPMTARAALRAPTH